MKRMSGIRQKTIAGLQAGDTFSISRKFLEGDVIQFADITRDFNPVHFDERFSRVKKFRGRICHGLLVASMISEIGGQIGWLASEMTFRFRKPVYFGDTIVCRFTITQIDDRGRAVAAAVYKNQNETIVLEASLKGLLPGLKEKKVIMDMIAEGDPTNKAG
jgi:3-hydroxybutyryl-CoA dehydratase